MKQQKIPPLEEIHGKPAADSGYEPVRPEWVFAPLAVAAGLFMLFVTPPFQAPDESGHFYRAFQLSEGRIVAERDGNSVGGHLPQSLYEMASAFGEGSFKSSRKVNMQTFRSLLGVPFEEEPRVFVNFWNTAVYSPVQYLPQVAGVWMGRAAGLSVLQMTYAGRLMNFLVWLVLVYLAVRTIPVFKWAVVMLALMPMHIFLAASMSGDAMTNGLALLLTALVMRVALSENRLPVATRVWVVVLCVLLSLSKLVYFPLSAMVLVVPANRFGGRQKKALFCCLAIGAAVLAEALWACLIRHTVTTIPGTQPREQILFMLSQPWAYLAVVAATLFSYWRAYIDMFIGVLGWLDTPLPLWVYISYPAALAAVALADRGEGGPMRLWQKALLVVFCLVVGGMIVSLQYITSSQLKAGIVLGIQSRYFIPLALPVLLLLYNQKMLPGLNRRWLAVAVPVYSLAVLIVACMCIVDRYYALGE
jgi:uncharacterized membrane protein